MTTQILEKAKAIMKNGYVCDHCLGRAFAQLTKGTTNAARGKAIRDVFAFSDDAGEKIDIDAVNLNDYVFRNAKNNAAKQKPTCKICGNLFDKLNDIMKKAMKKLFRFEYETFVVGTKVSGDIADREEVLWELIGTEYCEPVKAEINRELGKMIEKNTGKKADFENPDIVVLLDMDKNEIEIKPSQIWIYGLYQKLVRGIPQTKWPCRHCNGRGCKICKQKGKMYATSVEEIVAKPLIKTAKASGSSFHGSGREDINARCLGWRPFVMELQHPVKRKLRLKEMENAINKDRRVKVKLIKFCNKDTARKIKAAKLTKTYKIVVKFEKPVGKEDIKKIMGIKDLVKQRTPVRVAHRRADLIRERRILKLTGRITSRKEAEFVIKTEAGMYIKELVTGDDGRTEPSFTGVINNKAKVKALDVVEIEKIKV
ncbi:MAG: tRNA pseudouridine(54/55) synthase Pus10 [Candidatus Aenigmarchaeota archaeon]|nr:tRNA pseudouridine(54/55) synthase Pus10 [Candidatus Aenigmarchaeota archaeon]